MGILENLEMFLILELLQKKLSGIIIYNNYENILNIFIIYISMISKNEDSFTDNV